MESKAIKTRKRRRLSPFSTPAKATTIKLIKTEPKILPSSDSKPPPSNFSDLHSDVLLRIAAPFDLRDLYNASSACRQWRKALLPLREAMLLLRCGKRFKHGHGRVKPNKEKALDSFLRGARRGSALAMVDAGLMYWEMGRKEEARALYEKSAEIGCPAAQCNLGICYLQDDQPMPEEAVKWFHRAALSGYPRAQYNLALCLRKGNGVKCNLSDAARWYVKAAEGGYVRAMYNASLCYSLGEGGLRKNLARAMMWMKHAADCGHSKAQFEHGLHLFSSGDLVKALFYVELAIRAGETTATDIRDSILQSLSQVSRDRAMLSVDRWKPLKADR